MKTSIPAALKADESSSKWGKILNATPVVMTVVATLLAGLSSSEMTGAQYARSLAAQLQSKAGDQWNFFQGKKLRSAVQRNTLDVIANTTGLQPLDEAALRQAVAGTPAAEALAADSGAQTLIYLRDGTMPTIPPSAAVDSNVQAALHALETSQPETTLTTLLASVKDTVLEETLRNAQARALAFDALVKPSSQAIELTEQSLTRSSASAENKRSLTTARLNFNALRYDAEARLNQSVASLYELQVRKNNISAERHHRRSQRFFYGMLAAQCGVIISTLALAARKRNFLWSIAAGAGALAVAFAVYVYLYV